MEIRKYRQADEDALLRLIEAEGEEWVCYSAPETAEKYRRALADSITYMACEDGELCGYSRSLDDCGFYIYVCDLLVAKRLRGQGIGQKLMERLCADYSGQNVYVMSDVDEYYRKTGYRREGSIFRVIPQEVPK